jgi:cytochrome c553
LTGFQRTDDRPDGAVMKVVAHDLTEQNIVDVASYLQSLGQQR